MSNYKINVFALIRAAGIWAYTFKNIAYALDLKSFVPG